MKQDIETEENYRYRVILYGPKNFEDARLLKEMFVSYASSLMAASDVWEATRILKELHEVDRWLPMCVVFFREECKRREREQLKLDLDFVKGFKVDPEYLKSLLEKASHAT
jgi:hypothetical protein